ncbi:TPA: PBECR4 domain-containing protein [Streptococcus pneumoniae]
MSLKLLDCILDYQERFNGKTCQVSTNYKYLETFKVNFCLTDLHHLFGLHKITRDYASQTKPAIQDGVFILEDFRNILLYNDVIERISLYEFIGDIFYSKITSCCIVAKYLSKNTMKLDVIFFEDKNKRSAVLGLRRDKSGVFKPVTLHFTSAKKYAKVRKTDVKEMKWL